MTVLHGPLCPDGRAASNASPGAACEPAARPYVLAATILASAMAFIDGSVVTIALPAVQADLGADFRGLQWIVNGYTLMLGALLLVGGGLGDRLGRRRVFVAGIALFALASVVCAAAPTTAILIAGRVVQGIGAAALVPQSLAIIAAAYPKDVRGAAIGTWAAASAITTALGPPVGGFFVDALSWRAAFWINLPLAAGAIWLSWRHVPESRSDDAKGRIDWLGAGIAVAALGALTLGLTFLSEEEGGRLPLGIACVAAGALGIVLFLLVERRAADPIMPLGLFRSRVFTGTNIVTLFLYGSLSGVLFLLPFELIERRGLSATEVGLALLPFGLVIGLFSRFAGAAADRLGAWPFLAAGSVVVGLGCAGFALNVANFWAGVMLPILLLAAGMAAAVAPLTTAVMNSVPDAQSGAASGVNNAASRLAGLLAVAILGAVAAVVFAGAAPEAARFGVLPPIGGPGRTAVEDAFMTAYATAMGVAAAWALAAAACAYLFLRPARPAGTSRPS
jgi:EmrB/QacA subfamily drug resistance transporter